MMLCYMFFFQPSSCRRKEKEEKRFIARMKRRFAGFCTEMVELGKKLGTKCRDNETDDEAALSKEQDAVARFIRFNCPTNSTFFQGNEVHYFTGSKAIDTLMESKYGAKAKDEASALFPNRQTAVNYMRDLMSFQLFFRARKLVPKKKEEKERKEKDIKSSRLDKGEKKKKEDETVTETEGDEKKEEKKSAKVKEEDDKKKKKKVKLEVHDIQVFNDDKDVYVWIFDPTPLYKKIIGFLMVLGTIVGCLFPLWPMWLRQVVYYLSLAGIGIFGVIVIIAVLRTILFGVIWFATMGQHKLWILPNLTEDCGFFESFQPWYTYEYCPRDKGASENEKKKKRKKGKESDEEADEKVDVNDDRVVGNEDNESHASRSDDDVSEGSSVPPSPQSEIKKRRSRRADADYVIVKK